MHTNLIKFINFIGFLSKKYFFIFINDTIKITGIYTRTKKSNWLKCLKIYHNLYKIKFKKNHLIKWLKLDYKSKLQSYKINK